MHVPIVTAQKYNTDYALLISNYNNSLNMDTYLMNATLSILEKFVIIYYV